jgi:hypothetical protein
LTIGIRKIQILFMLISCLKYPIFALQNRIFRLKIVSRTNVINVFTCSAVSPEIRFLCLFRLYAASPRRKRLFPDAPLGASVGRSAAAGKNGLSAVGFPLPSGA